MADLQITQGTIQNPYQEYTFTIAAGKREPVFFDHRYFRVMSQSGGTLKVRFGDSGSETSIVGAGIGVEHLQAINKLELINSHATDSMTITIAVSMGSISDSRLSLTGTITVNQVIASTIATVADIAMGTGAATLIAALDSTRKAIHISNILANGQICRVGDSNVGAARGAELGIGETRIITNTAAVYGYFVGAGKSIGVMVES
jgi:hypothetical protein